MTPIREEESGEEEGTQSEEGVNAATMETDPRRLAPPVALQGKTTRRPFSEKEADVEQIKVWVQNPNQKIHIKHLRWDLNKANGQSRTLDKERAVQMALAMKDDALPRQPVKILVVQSQSMASPFVSSASHLHIVHRGNFRAAWRPTHRICLVAVIHRTSQCWDS